MTTIRIREREVLPDGRFAAIVDFDGAGEYEVEVADPFDERRERELTWYFEQHLRFPFLDWDRRDAAAAAVAEYGRALFGQVFGAEAAYDYRRLRDAGFDDTRIEVIGSSAFHRLHWEALAEASPGPPLAVRVPVTRRVAALGSRFDLPAGRPTLNVLVVTARPDGRRDVGYRTVSRPLLDALRRAVLPVNVELVRPGTWPALRDALREATDRHGTGWYHAVHFDLHGQFSAHKDLETGRHDGRLLFTSLDVPPFEGRQAMLLFETATEGVAQPVSAASVAALLAEHRVPMALLNACQSGAQAGNEASLAQHLTEAGVPFVVGMAYSVTVSAAQTAMPVLYGHLAEGRDPVAASRAARRALFEQRGRAAYFDQDVDLEDWILPVVFSQRPFSVSLSPATAEEQRAYYERAAAVGEGPSVRYGFVGRDLDVQAVERRLLLTADRNQVLLRGMAGTGKSTLLAHLGWWWRRTGLVEHEFSFSYEERAWTVAQIVRQVAKGLLSHAELAVFDSLGDAAKAERVAHLLRAQRHLLVLDNGESITASPAAIPHSLREPERKRLAAFLARLRGGRTLVLIGSRQDEAWLADDSFGDNTYELLGLDPQAASQFAERILHAHGGTGHLTDPEYSRDLRALLKLLRGYPLPMAVVLPALAHSDPATVLRQLQTGDSDADEAGLIQRAVEYSHGGLDPAIQRSMLLLAPFTAVIPSDELLRIYQGHLESHEAVKALGPIDMPAALAETTRVGLTAELIPGWLREVPILPYFLRKGLSSDPGLYDAAEAAHYRLHYAIARDVIYRQLDANAAEERLAGRFATELLYANFMSAIEYALPRRLPSNSLIKTISHYLEQTQQHEVRLRLFEDIIARYPEPRDDGERFELYDLHHLAGKAAFGLHRLAAAETHLRAELTLKEEVGNRRSYANTYVLLGQIAVDDIRFEDAREHLRIAYDLCEEFGNEGGLAGVRLELAQVEQQLGDFDAAERYCGEALEFFRETGHGANISVCLSLLGEVAAGRGDYEAAERYFRESVEIDSAYRDTNGMAYGHYRLATLARDCGEFEQAEEHFRTALELFLENGDETRVAMVYNGLANVLTEQGRLVEAARYYRQAVDAFERLGDRRPEAVVLSNLGAVLRELGKDREALKAYLQSAVIRHGETGEWGGDVLDEAKTLNSRIAASDSQAIFESIVPAEVVAELRAALER